MSDKKILGIDTSTENCTVALYDSGSILKTKKETGKNKHNRVVASFIDEILEGTEVDIVDLDGIAINIGPGSFTGLRIGLSIAKGLAFPNDIPLLPVKSIAIVKEKIDQKGNQIVFVRSHKENIYYSIVSDSEAKDIDPEIKYATVNEVLQENEDIDFYYGNYCFEKMDNKRGLNICYPDASTLVRIAGNNYEELVEASSSELEPYYLTNFEAKKWKPGVKKRG